MRKLTLFSGTAICIAVVAFVFTLNDSATKIKPSKSITNSIDSDLIISQKLNELTEIIQQIKLENSISNEKSQKRQIQLNTLLSSLESRVNLLETAKNYPGGSDSRPVHTKSIEESKDSSESETVEDSLSLPRRRSESKADFGLRLDNVLKSGYVDIDSTSLATEQTTESLVHLSSVQLEDMTCNDRYCRATFRHEKGKDQEISKLFGRPPFMGEGFTIVRPNNLALLYFTQPNVSFEDIRKELSSN